MQDAANSATHGTRSFPGHMLHRAVNNQDVIKMSDGHQTLLLGNILQLYKVGSFHTIDCTNCMNLLDIKNNTLSSVLGRKYKFQLQLQLVLYHLIMLILHIN